MGLAEERLRLLETAVADYALRHGLTDHARAALGMPQHAPLGSETEALVRRAAALL
jgi:hypothetical protein